MSRIVPVDPAAPDPAALDAAVAALAAGEVIGLPTDTVYGVAVDPWRPGATDRVFATKQRPREVVLPVLVAGEDQLDRLCADVPAAARELMARWWPGPLTIVVPARADLGADLGGDGRTVGVRCPDHPVARAACRLAGPLATTSANRHGEPPTTTADLLAAALPGVAVVLDAGPCDRPPSTVVDATRRPLRLLRQGGIAFDALMGAQGAGA